MVCVLILSIPTDCNVNQKSEPICILLIQSVFADWNRNCANYFLVCSTLRAWSMTCMIASKFSNLPIWLPLVLVASDKLCIVGESVPIFVILISSGISGCKNRSITLLLKQGGWWILRPYFVRFSWFLSAYITHKC